jgi:hypothetical protein
MKKTNNNATVLLMTLLLFGFDTASQSAAQVTAAADEDSGEHDVAAEALRQDLRNAIADRSQWDSLHLSVRCIGEDGMRAVEVYGNGVGIWDFRRQFTLQPEEVSSLIEILDRADFASYADVYGGSKAPDPRTKEKKGGACCALQVICSVELSLAGGTKQSVQVRKGDLSAELRQLADDLLDTCEKPGQAGTMAVDLADGLEKVAGGVLAPETFRVLLHRKPESGAEAGDLGFLLRVSGGLVTSRGYDAAGRLLDPVNLMLDPTDVAALARELAEAGLAELPLNLFAPDYKDLSVRVLDHEASVQARRFVGMTPTTHAEHQPGFERIYDALYRLHVRVLSEGGPMQNAGG